MHFTLQCLALLDLENVRHWLEWGGYGMLFGLLVACGMGLPLPEDVPLITAGVLVARGHMDFTLAACIGWLGIMGGDAILYYLGYRYGRNIVRMPFIGRHITLERLHKAEALFLRYGIAVVAIGRLFAGIRGAMVVSAGTTRFNYVKFFVADGLSAVVSGGMFLILGIWCGHHMQQMRDVIHRFEGWMQAVAAVLLLALIAFIWWRSRQPRFVPPHHHAKTDAAHASAPQYK
jgi:membrane protein DedA with SNARE-associated domain